MYAGKIIVSFKIDHLCIFHMIYFVEAQFGMNQQQADYPDIFLLFCRD